MEKDAEKVRATLIFQRPRIRQIKIVSLHPKGEIKSAPLLENSKKNLTNDDLRCKLTRT